MRKRWLLSCVLLGLVAAVVAGLAYVHDTVSQILYDRATLGVLQLSKDLQTFHARYGRYPSKQKGFQELVDRGLAETVPRDPWNRPYRYRLEGGVPVVLSHGADKAPGGEGYDADISRRVEPVSQRLMRDEPLPAARGTSTAGPEAEKPWCAPGG